MQPVIRPRVKICCIADVDEARLAVRLGASALGLVSAMPSGPGVIEEAMIAAIADATPPGAATFLLTSLQDVEAIIAQQRRCRTNTIQITDRVERGTLAELRAALPGIALVQVVHVTSAASVDEALTAAPHVHAILLDSGNPTLAVKELGGTIGRSARAFGKPSTFPCFSRAVCVPTTYARPWKPSARSDSTFAAACARTAAWTKRRFPRFSRPFARTPAEEIV